MKIAGFDIGGANTKVAIINFDNGEIENIEIDLSYLPMWSDNDTLQTVLTELIEKICPIDELDGVGISMTAELVDAYETKKDGVLDIANKANDLFDLPLGFVTLDGVVDINGIIENPLKAAAANWIATAPIAAKISDNCIFVDTGSTTTDIIPVKNGKECAKGRSDMERLGTGELVYTGTLRTNLCSFLYKVPLSKNGKTIEYRVGSELFAETADVYRILDLISEDDYVCGTYDGEGKSKIECARRVARVLCADLDILNKNDIKQLCETIHKTQIKQIAEAIGEVSKRENIDTIVTTGLGKDILDKPAAESLGLNVKSMNEFLTDEECVVAPAVGTAILMEEYLRNNS